MISLRMPQECALWLALRKAPKPTPYPRISATDMAAVFHMGYKSKKKLWEEKRGKETPFFGCAATAHGQYWEPVGLRACIDRFFPPHSWRYFKPNFKDLNNPISCSPDLVLIHKRVELMYGLELKCPYSSKIPQKKEDII